MVFRNARIATLSGPARPRSREEMRDIGLLEGSLEVEDGKIVAVRPGSHSGEGVDLGGKLVVPGLVDAHTHLAFAGNRSGEFADRCAGATYEEIAAKGGGIRSTVAAVRTASREDLRGSAERNASWMLACGTTTAEAKSGYGLDLKTEIDLLEAIGDAGASTGLRVVPTFLGLHAVPADFADADTYCEHVVDKILPEVAGRGLAKYVDAFVERGYFGPAHATKLAVSAKAHGLGLRLHVDQLTDGGGAALAADLGAATADHLEQTGQAGIAALEAAGVQPVLLPISVFALRKTKYPEARAMIEAGLAVVLATDFNPGSAPSPSLPFAMTLGCLQMGMTPEEALCATTINAAYSVGLGDEVGSIEAGKSADFVVLDLQDVGEIPYWVGAPMIRAVYVRGRLVSGSAP